MIENTTVHHAHHLATLRNAVDNNPLDVVKTYKSFAKAGHIFSADLVGSIDRTLKISSKSSKASVQGRSVSGSSSSNGSASGPHMEDIEFNSLDSIRDSVEIATETAEKGGMFSIFARKKKYET
jgi:hypothetical protein